MGDPHFFDLPSPEGRNVLTNKPPIKPPYKVLFTGEEVMAQLPLIQPT